MISVSLQLSSLDYKRASQLVFGGIVEAQPASWLSRALLSIIGTLYVGAMFVISTAPNNLDPHTLRLLRGSSLALVLAPILFLVLLVFEKRRRTVLAAASLPAPPESIHLAANEEGLFVVTTGIKTEFQWSGIKLQVQDSEFSALALPRTAPLPLPVGAFSSSVDYFAFLRSVQGFIRASAAEPIAQAGD
jgi:hypothetical protein